MATDADLWGALTDTVGDGILVTDADLDAGPTIVFVNGAVERSTGYRAAELVGASPRIFQGPMTSAVERRRIAAALRGGEHVRSELVNYRKDGSQFLVELDITPVRDRAGALTGFVGIQRDVTEARLTDRWFRSLIEHSSEMITVSDPDGVVRYVSPSIEAVLGWDPASLVGRNGRDLVHPDDRQRVAAGLAEHSRRRGTTGSVQFRLLAADGSWHWLEAVTTNLLEDPAVHGLVVNARDVTSRRAVEEERDLLHAELHARAIHDHLTGLVNRDEGKRRLVEDAAGPGRFDTVVTIDLDGLSLVNDTFGHDAGDVVLRDIAHRLRAVVPPGSLVARFGGDEFLLALVRAGAPLEEVVEDVMAAVRTPLALAGRPVSVTGCAGVAATVAGDAERTLRHVDMALRLAKSRGEDGWARFEPALEARAHERVEIEVGLRTAASAGQLRLEFQPSFDVASGAVRAVEALLRWDHPQRGLLLPGAFIPVAEATGQIVELGHWVVSQACAARARLRATHPHATDGLTMWVNVSARELERDAFASEVVARAAIAGLGPGELGVEITETAVMADPALAVRHLQTLAAAGIRVAIDDFGTGYSSIAYLARLPVDLVKFDWTFTQAAVADPTTAIVLRAVTGLVRDLGATTCLEGIETPDHLAAAAELGADTVSGFLLAVPVREDQLAAHLCPLGRSARPPSGTWAISSGPAQERRAMSRCTVSIGATSSAIEARTIA